MRMEEEIKAEFVRNGFGFDNEEEILQKCLTFCIQYKLSASELVSSWDVYSMNRGLEFTVRSSHIAAFLEHLQNEQTDKVREKQKHSGLHLYSSDVAMILDGNYEDTNAILDSPSNKQSLPHEKTSISARKGNGSKFTPEKLLESDTPFCSRKKKFVVHSTLSEHLVPVKSEVAPSNSEDEIIKRVQPSQRCALVIDRSQPEPGCRFMYNKIEDKITFLEDRIKRQAVACVSSGRYEEPVDPSVASQKIIFAVGMIWCEEEARLKERPVQLQSSIEHSGGQRVRLDLQKLSQYSVFPGQVVGVEGYNPSGHFLIASKLIDSVPLSNIPIEENPAKRQALDNDLELSRSSQDMAEVSMIVAAGPFTTSDNLLFEPLTELLSYALRKQPQLLLLLGPFIDYDHPELKKGTVNRTFDEMFHTEILGKLQDYVEYMGPAVRVMLVPSIRDANHDKVFPQPAFEIPRTDFSNQIHSISNPGLFSANEVKLACCTVDILKHLSAEEISRIPQGESRLTNLAKHILNQRSFYPLYPPAEEVPLDFSLGKEALQLSLVPDILVLPSDLTPFLKVLSLGEGIGGEERLECICVNPGRLARGEVGGFFAEINYRKNARSPNASIIRI